MTPSVLDSNSMLKYKRYEALSAPSTQSGTDVIPEALPSKARKVANSTNITHSSGQTKPSFQLFPNLKLPQGNGIKKGPQSDDDNYEGQHINSDSSFTSNSGTASTDSIIPNPVDYSGLLEDTNELIESRKSLMQELKIDHKLYEDTINWSYRSINENSRGRGGRTSKTIHNSTNSNKGNNDNGGINTPNTEEGLPLEYLLEPVVSISSVSKKRAEKVRNIIESYYSCLEKYQNTVHYEMGDHTIPKYPNVEGVFNPLQIIRNRRIRKKHNEKLTAFPFSNVKLPSRVFSKYKTQHLIWQVNLNEYNNDVYWRENHIQELKNSKGELWFPKTEHHLLNPTKTGKPTRMKRLHEQLFTGFDGEFHKEEDEIYNSSSITGTEGEKRLNSLPKINESSASLARHEHYIPNSLKKHNATSKTESLTNGSKSPGNLLSLVSVGTKSDEEVDQSNSVTHGTLELAPPLIKVEKSNSPNKDESPVRSLENKEHSNFSTFYKSAGSFDSLSVGLPSQQLQQTPLSANQLRGTSTRRTSNLSAYNSYSDDDYLGNTPGTNSALESGEEDELLEQVKTVRSLQTKIALSELKLNSFDSTMNSILAENEAKIENQLKKFGELQNQSDEVSKQLMARINEFDSSLDTFNEFNYGKSIKIEELLGYSDRTNGEINTSVTLKLRNLSERKDQLAKLDDEWIFSYFYNFLENLIVLVLWIVWIFVEVWRMVKQVLMFLVALLKWIFL